MDKAENQLKEDSTQRTWSKSKVLATRRAAMMARVTHFEDGTPAWTNPLNLSVPVDSDLVAEMAVSFIPERHFGLAKRNYRVFYAIFAGRRHFMDIHLKYTDLMLRLGLVDEVHLWDFCSTDADSDFLSAFSRGTSLDGYKLFTKPSKDTNRAGSLKDGYLWASFYQHYATNTKYKDTDIFMKADDDVVFIDIRHLENFLKGVSPDHVHFPSIVNNDAGLVLQARRKVHPMFVEWLHDFQNAGVNFTARFEQFLCFPRTEPDCPSFRRFDKVCPLSSLCAPGIGWSDAWFTKGMHADIMHQVFLEQPHRFMRRMLQHPRFVTLNGRISINMLAMKFQLARRLLSTFLSEYCCDDEGFFGKWPTISNFSHIIDTQLTVVHFAFKSQYTGYGSNILWSLPQYAMLANTLTDKSTVQQSEH